jgi:hypothetical protein
VDFADGASAIVAYWYPMEWLTPLAAELARRGEAEVVQEGSATTGLVRVSEESLHPKHIHDRPEQPSASDAVLEETIQGMTISIPPPGVYRGNGAFFCTWCTIWCGILIPFTLGFVPAAFLGLVKWNDGPRTVSPAFALCFLTPFWLVGLGSLLALCQNGYRRARLAVEGSRLTIEEHGVLGSFRREWESGSLRNVEVTAEYLSDDGPDRLKAKLRIVPAEGEPFDCLDHRPKPELEWIATRLRRQLFPRPRISS